MDFNEFCIGKLTKKYYFVLIVMNGTFKVAVCFGIIDLVSVGDMVAMITKQCKQVMLRSNVPTRPANLQLCTDSYLWQDQYDQYSSS